MYRQVVVALLLAVAASQAERRDYTNYKVIGVVPTSFSALKMLRDLGDDLSLELNFWNDPRSVYKTVYMSVPPKSQATLEKKLTANHLPHFVRHSNLQKVLDENRQAILSRPRKPFRAAANFEEDVYHTLDEINAYLEALEQENPGSVSLENIGTTFEGRPLYVIKLLNRGKPIVFIESGVHAREWIAPATSLYFLKHLVEGTDSDFTQYKADYEWHFLINTNPDGYEYTWTTDRLWRKNRQTFSGAACLGADVNRNADSNFGGEGSSNVVCSETYHGPYAFSELESIGLRDYTIRNADNIGAYISFHSYSQLWMFPYGYTSSRPADYTKLNNLAKAATDAIFNYAGTRYDYGPIASTIYVASGGTIDWAYDETSIKNIWTAELPDTGFYGFELPERQIVPVSEETWQGVKATLDGL